MKRKLFHICAAVAAAAASIGCSADNDIESQRPDEGMTLTLRTEGIIGDTRTEFDAAVDRIRWSASDNAVFYSNGIGRISQIEILDDDCAQFRLSGMRPDGTARTIQGFYPVEARWSDGHLRNTDNQIEAFALTLKSRQEASSTTFDPGADILIADNLYDVEVSAGEKNIADVRFGRPVAVSQIDYVIDNAELKSSGERVRSITFHVDSKSAAKYLAGNFYFNPATFRYVDVDGNELDTADSEFFDSARASSVQVMLSDTPDVNADFSAWIVTAPVVLSQGDIVTFTIRTTAGTVITKSVVMSREVAFKNTRRNRLTVNIDDTATIKVGDAGAIHDGYYVIATEDSMMTSDVVGSALGFATLPSTWIGEGENRKLSVSEDRAVWYISRNETSGTYTISSKLNGRFINCTAAKSCYLKDDATELKIQPAGDGNYNISVNSTAGRVLGYNQSSPRFAFYDNNSAMINDLQIIPVYIDNRPDFKLLKEEITVNAAGEYTEKDVYQLRNASEKNLLIDVDGTVVTSASIANAAVSFTVAEGGGSGWIDIDFNGSAYRIAVVISSDSGASATLTYEDIADKLSNSYSEGTYGDWSWKAAKSNNGIQINGTKGYIKIPDIGSAIASVTITTSTTYKSGYKLHLNTSVATTNTVMTATSGGESYFQFDLTALDATYNSLYIISGNAMYISTVEVTYSN